MLPFLSESVYSNKLLIPVNSERGDGGGGRGGGRGGDDAGRGDGGGGLRGAARRSPESLESPDGRRSKEQGIGHNGIGEGEVLTSRSNQNKLSVHNHCHHGVLHDERGGGGVIAQTKTYWCGRVHTLAQSVES